MDIESGKVRITLRIEPDVYAMLVDVISKTGRSLNSEITARVRDSFCTDSPVVLTTTEKVFQRIIQEELDKRQK
ncbi:Arc family DNA-binding protein [Candidatus Thiothrix sp. Deng01]|uniref:Arc family DNA-binding protein n=1 Tax=Candidatus Thiothrix phosphatis TaxID=3112415 RepID=A0ABU6CYT5_9GAMM|nr:Arc family DNA-binding protein [Candidatus Thiothrix sp. Deng01]MEB4592002.1 Arc family DNA-binding protein [Candidatus Thiothrix sp. Deng01]